MWSWLRITGRTTTLLDVTAFQWLVTATCSTSLKCGSRNWSGSPLVRLASVLTPGKNRIRFRPSLALPSIFFSTYFRFPSTKYRDRLATHGLHSTHLSHNAHNLRPTPENSNTVAIFNVTSAGQCSGYEAAIQDSRKLYPSLSSGSLSSVHRLQLSIWWWATVLPVLAVLRWRWYGGLLIAPLAQLWTNR